MTDHSTEDKIIAALSRFMTGEPGLDAVRVNLEGRQLSVATIGEVDLDLLHGRLQHALEEIDSDFDAGKSGGSQVHESVIVNRSGEGTLLEKPSCMTAPKLRTWRELPWLELDPGEEEDDWRELAIFAAGCGIFLLLGQLVDSAAVLSGWGVRIFFLVAMIFGGWDAARDVWKTIRKGVLDIHFLMLAVAIGAACVDAWGEGALLLFLFSLSGAIEAYAHARTRREIQALFRAAPKTALRIRENGEEEEIPVEKVEAGMHLRILPGDTIPVDGDVIEGKTAIDESNLTGESRPISKSKGAAVFSGTANLWGAVDICASRPVQESSLQKIIRLIREAQRLKAPAQRFTDKFGTGYTWCILLATFGLFLLWWTVFDLPAFFEGEDGTHSAFYRAMTVLVVASPCALVLSIPSAILASIAWGARHGVLFRGGAAVEKLAEVDTIALDKTGTLTYGDLQVEDIRSLPPGKETEVAELAYSIERHSEHPIARAIVAYGKEKGLGIREVEDFQSLSGQGVRARRGDSHIVIGRRDLMARGRLKDLIGEVPDPPPAFTEIWIIHGQLLGRILMRDRVRTESRPVIERLKSFGMQTLMLTGDREAVAESIGQEVGLDKDEIRANLRPEDKVNIIREMTRSGNRVAMVGDGVNDAPSLAAAYVSIGMGARGTDAALEQCEVVLMKDRIDNFLNAYELSRQAKVIIRQNLAIALGTVVVMVTASILGWIPLSAGVLAHEGSTVIVCVNSLRLLFVRPAST
jgi:Cd2+/Zn2+-exporting ATPase